MQAALRKAASGDAEAQLQVALAYLNGSGLPHDTKAAVTWLTKAAENHLPKAQIILGETYEAGRIVPLDYPAALRWFKACTDKLPGCAARVGHLYRSGLGVAQDLAEARHYYLEAANRGDANGQVNLAILYRNGWGGAVDQEQAFRWYLAAAEQGEITAMNGAGYSYLEGYGVERDPAKAFYWLKRAAEAGQPNAMQTLGVMYWTEDGAPPDLFNAYRWLAMAIRTYPPNDAKLPLAQKAFREVSGLLSEAQRQPIDIAVAQSKPAAAAASSPPGR